MCCCTCVGIQKCDLCPKKDGAFKRTDSGGWAHVVCALYIPEASFGNNTTMEPIVVTKIPKDRFTKACYICEEQGSESQATTGACMTCNKPHCRMAFHVTCAQKARLLSEEEDPRDPNNVLYVGYCSNHYGRQEKLNYSNLRRQSISQNLSPAPTSPLASPFPSTKKETNLSLLSSSKAGKTFAKRDRDILDPPTRRRVKRRKLSSSTESNASEGITALADSVEDTDSVKQPLNHEDLSSTGNTSHANSSSSSSNSRNPSISTVEISMVSPKSDDSTIPVETGDKQETENDNIMTREQSLAPVEQEVITADTVVENTDETTMSMLTNEPPVVTPAVTKKVVRRKKSASALPARSSSTVPRRRKQRNMSVAQNKASKKNSSSSQQQSLAPPTSLMELLQRQWEQTAQFVMDQSSRQSNAGTMLSRLYQLQTENQQMQERITNLAAQREFLLATNSQLGSIISESQQHQQHTTNGLSEPSYMSVETADIMSTNLSTALSSSSMSCTITRSNASVTTTSDNMQTSLSSGLVQASSFPSIDSPSMFTMPPANMTGTVVTTSSSTETTRPASLKSKEVLPGEKKKQRNIKHSKQSTKLQQHLKATPAAMPGSVSLLGLPTIKPPPSDGPPPHSSSVLIGNLVPLEPVAVTSDLMSNPQVIPPSRAGSFLPPYTEIAMEMNGKTVMLSRDITAVTSAIGGPIPAMSPVATGHNVVR